MTMKHRCPNCSTTFTDSHGRSGYLQAVEKCIKICEWSWSHAAWSYKETVAKMRALASTPGDSRE